MTNPTGVALFWLGVVGLAQFGGLWVVLKWVEAGHLQQGNREWLETMMSAQRRRRLSHWVQFVPALTVVSLGVLVAGVIV